MTKQMDLPIKLWPNPIYEWLSDFHESKSVKAEQKRPNEILSSKSDGELLFGLFQLNR